jgi:uncharacterized membrane protein
MTPLIATHAFSALTAILLGAWQLFFSRKGRPLHRLVGRVWVGLMLYVSVTSFWIRELRHGQFSLLHILSIVTIVAVILGILDARRGNLRGHVGNMLGSWIGLCNAGAFALAIPDRDIPQFVLADLNQAVAAGVSVVLVAVVIVGTGRLLTRVPAVESPGA